MHVFNTYFVFISLDNILIKATYKMTTRMLPNCCGIVTVSLILKLMDKICITFTYRIYDQESMEHKNACRRIELSILIVNSEIANC